MLLFVLSQNMNKWMMTFSLRASNNNLIPIGQAEINRVQIISTVYQPISLSTKPLLRSHLIMFYETCTGCNQNITAGIIGETNCQTARSFFAKNHFIYTDDNLPWYLCMCLRLCESCTSLWYHVTTGSLVDRIAAWRFTVLFSIALTECGFTMNLGAASLRSKMWMSKLS